MKLIKLSQNKIVNTSQITTVKQIGLSIYFHMDSQVTWWEFNLNFNTQKEADDYFYSLMKKIGAIELKNEI